MKLTKQNILKVLEQEDMALDVKSITSLEDLDILFNIIEREFDDLFSVRMVVNVFGSDYWLQAEYYSKKIGKTIIFDYDYPSQYESLEELADIYLATAKEITEFENKLTKI